MTARSSADHYLLSEERNAFRRYRLFNEIYRPATTERLALLPSTPDMNILEIGCRIGDTACCMAKDIVPAAHRGDGLRRLEANRHQFGNANHLNESAKWNFMTKLQ